MQSNRTEKVTITSQQVAGRSALQLIDSFALVVAMQALFPGFALVGACFYGVVLSTGSSLANSVLFNSPNKKLIQIGLRNDRGNLDDEDALQVGKKTVGWGVGIIVFLGWAMNNVLIQDFTGEYARHHSLLCNYALLATTVLGTSLLGANLMSSNQYNPDRSNADLHPVQFLLQPFYQLSVGFCWAVALQALFHFTTAHLSLVMIAAAAVHQGVEYLVNTPEPETLRQMCYASETKGNSHGENRKKQIGKQVAWWGGAVLMGLAALELVHRYIPQAFGVALEENNQPNAAFAIQAMIVGLFALMPRTLCNMIYSSSASLCIFNKKSRPDVGDGSMALNLLPVSPAGKEDAVGPVVSLSRPPLLSSPLH